MLIGGFASGLSRYLDYVDGTVMFSGKFFNDQNVNSIWHPNRAFLPCTSLDSLGELTLSANCDNLMTVATCEINMEVTGCYSNKDIADFTSSTMSYQIYAGVGLLR